MKKTLAAYFSASGTTRKVAEMIAEAGDCALYEITPKELYTNDDLNWMNKKSRSSVEMSDKKIRPQITDTDAHIEEYDTIRNMIFPVKRSCSLQHPAEAALAIQ